MYRSRKSKCAWLTFSAPITTQVPVEVPVTDAGGLVSTITSVVDVVLDGGAPTTPVTTAVPVEVPVTDEGGLITTVTSIVDVVVGGVITAPTPGVPIVNVPSVL